MNSKERKIEMIREIIKYSDVFKSSNELEKLNFSEIESIHKSCLIPLLKRINKQKI